MTEQNQARPEVLARIPAAMRAAGREQVRRQLQREAQHRLDRAALRTTQRLRTQAQASPDMLGWAVRRMTKALERVRRGTESARTVQARLVALAPALPLAIYDAAVDALEVAALESGQALTDADWEEARTRQATDGTDAHTREARRRQARTHRRTYGKGSAVGTRIEANDASRVTGATPWRGEYGSTADLAGEVVALRPVWAVGAAGGPAVDAAEQFEQPYLERARHAVGSAIEHAGLGRGVRGRVVYPEGHGWEIRTLDSAEPQIQDRRQWAVAREIGPESRWRVPSIPAFSPLVARAEEVRADHRAAEALARQGAAEYQRDGWAHLDRPAETDEQQRARLDWARQNPALAGFVRMIQRAEHAAWLRSLGATAEGDGVVRYGSAPRPASPRLPDPPSPARGGVIVG